MKILNRKKVKILLVTVILVATAFFIYKSKTEIKQNDHANQETVSVQAERGTIKETVSASGQIETANYLTVTTSVNGIVNEVYVKEGDIVKKGTPVMDITLSSEGEESLASAWSSYLTAKNALTSAQSSLITLESALINAEEDFEDEKVRNSYQSHDERIAYTLTENDVEVAQINYDTQFSVISQKQASLNKAWLTYQAQSSTVVAPGDGIMANILLIEGMNITNSLSERTSQSVASIRKEGTPIASLNISEVDINKVKVGQTVELSLNSIKNKTFTGEVVGIDKIGTITSGVSNYPVIVKFFEDSDSVLPNMGVDAEIIIQEKENVVYVPSSAIISFRGSTMVRVEGKERPVTVEIGISTNEHTEIVSGIGEGTTVLINTLPTSGFTVLENEQGQRGGGGRGIFPGTGGPH